MLRLAILLALAVLSFALTGCSLLLRSAGGAALRGSAAAARASLATRTLSRMSIGQAARARGALRFTARRKAQSITLREDGSLFANASRIGRWHERDGRIDLVDSTGTLVPSGVILQGRLYGPDEGGNMVPIAAVVAVVRSGARLTTMDTLPTGTVRSGEKVRAFTRDGNMVLVENASGSRGWIADTSLSIRIEPLPDVEYRSIRISTELCVETALANVLVSIARDSNSSLIVAHSSRDSLTAKLVAKSIQDVGREVTFAIVDDAYALICGGDIFYHPNGFLLARDLQIALLDHGRFRLSSNDRFEGMIVWLALGR